MMGGRFRVAGILLIACLVLLFGMISVFAQDEIEVDDVSVDDTEEVKSHGSFLAGVREFDSNLVVEMGNVTVSYTIYNIGDQSAFEVELEDIMLTSEDFEAVDGVTSISFDEITPGSSVSRSVTFIAKSAGYYGDSPKSSVYKPSAAKISYATERTSDTKRVHYIASKGILVVEDVESFKKRTDKHILDWIAFSTLSLLFTAVPYAISQSSLSKLDKRAVRKTK
uniref:Translocon-associated protein subunit beta n=1 Tax=Timspurckia oligopyrenoides TaxID=708627 RepID=A0A6T6M0W7_9RHOD|mmetsp:Transcript_2880/g.5061  ORF Transcript_2880/g.5061 Transcript_2880/m.5061 type:complete len:224 (+) Transcript_2880:141-812(+)